MTADVTIEATPGQAAAIERDGFLVVAGPSDTCYLCVGSGVADGWEGEAIECAHCDGTGFVPVPTTKPCPEHDCRGGEVSYPEWEGRVEECPTCNGDGTVPIVVDVVVPERRECQNCTNGFVMGLHGPEDCICDQGFVSLCLRCGQPYEMDHSPVKYGGVPVAQHRDRRGSKTVECPDGSGWIIPARTLLRGTAEAVPVVDKWPTPNHEPCLYVGNLGPLAPALGTYLWLSRSVEPLKGVDVTHHFADVPRPEVGDTAWIIRGER